MDEADTKVFFQLENGNTESLWAKKNGGLYEIRNVPFFAYGVSFGDVVRGNLVKDKIYYVETVAPGGHSTYRVFQRSDDDHFFFYLNILNDLGCSYEKATTSLYGIDVPKSSDVDKVYEVLELGEKKGVWEFEEGHCGHDLMN